MWRKCGCNEGQQSRLLDYREHRDPGNVSSSDSQLFIWCCLSPRLQPTVCLGALSGKTWEEECWMQMELSILQMSHISPLHLQTCSLTDSHPSLCGGCFVSVKEDIDWVCVIILKILPKASAPALKSRKVGVYIIIQSGVMFVSSEYSNMVQVVIMFTALPWNSTANVLAYISRSWKVNINSTLQIFIYFFSVFCIIRIKKKKVSYF